MKKEETSGWRISLLAMIALLFLLSSVQVEAFRASGGSMNSQISPATVVLSANSTHVAAGMGPLSSFGSGSYAGFFGLNISQAADNYPPIVTPIWPINGQASLSTRTNFSFTATDASGLEYCLLYVDLTPTETIISPPNGLNEISATISPGNHTWKVQCYDTVGNNVQSSLESMVLIVASTFDNESTDLSTANLSNIVNLTLAKSEMGKIFFPTNTSLEGVLDLSSYVIIRPLSIFINSSELPMLNKSATLTMYNIPYQRILLWKDGVLCTTCEIDSFTGDTLVFNVSSFSNYSVSSNSRLEISDDSDTQIIYTRLSFYANFTNRSDNQPLAAADCLINFSDGSHVMVYNTSSQLFTYTRDLNFGVHFYNVSCTDSDVEPLVGRDYASISLFDGPKDAELDVNGGQNYDQSNNPSSLESLGGFINQVGISTRQSTGSWQGYYGDVNLLYVLGDEAGYVFHNWTATQPTGEIYASRALDVNFATSKCANTTEISQEELYMMLQSTDHDSVNNTFNRTLHPEFSVGNLTFANNTCRSTNLFVNGAAQNDRFFEILLSDGASNMIYTGIVEQDASGFDNGLYDFEMLVGVEGAVETSRYYFYAELDG